MANITQSDFDKARVRILLKPFIAEVRAATGLAIAMPQQLDDDIFALPDNLVAYAIWFLTEKSQLKREYKLDVKSNHPDFGKCLWTDGRF